MLSGGASANTIGGATAAYRNIVSGNTQSGILVTENGTDLNIIKGNFIGTNAAGTSAVPNDYGILVSNGSQNNTIGGTGAERRILFQEIRIMESHS